MRRSTISQDCGSAKIGAFCAESDNFAGTLFNGDTGFCELVNSTGQLFMVPFYFIEYGLAQLAALQIWRASRGDEAGAVAAYRRALALGGTRPLPELYAAAGARLAFDAATMADLVGLIEEELDALDAQPAPVRTTPLRRPGGKDRVPVVARPCGHQVR